MNKKTIIIVSLSFILAAISIFTITNQTNSTIDNEFVISDTSSVEKIFIVNKNNDQVSLEKRKNIWYVDTQNEAIGENVNILLNTMMYIDIRKPVSKASYNTMVKQLATNSVKVEIYQNKALINIFGIELLKKTRKTKVFYVGAPTRDYKGTVMKMEDSDDIYITHLQGFNGYLSERFSANYADWVNHRIFNSRIQSITSVKVEFGHDPNQSYEIKNLGNRQFKLYSLHNNSAVGNYDTLRLLEELAAFRDINFEALLDDFSQEKLDSLSSSIPLRTISLSTIDKGTRTIKMYRRPNFDKKTDFNGRYFDYDMDRMYAIVDGINTPVTVQYFVIDNISRPLSYLLGIDNKPKSSLSAFQIGQKN